MLSVMQELPPHIRFEYEAVEDRDASIEAGYKIWKNVPMATITPAGSKENTKQNAEEWLANQKRAVLSGGGNPRWYEHFQACYDRWREGNEMPEYGTPVVLSLMFSPAEQKMLIGANVRTVEEAAIMGEPTMQMIGMGARALKAKAEAALQAANSTGKLAEENQALKVKLETVERTLEEMREAMQALQADADKPKRGRPRMDEAA